MSLGLSVGVVLVNASEPLFCPEGGEAETTGEDQTQAVAAAGTHTAGTAHHFLSDSRSCIYSLPLKRF